MKVIIAYPPFSEIKGTPLLSQNRQYQVFSQKSVIYPIVPASAATLLEQAGHEVIWLDGIAEDMPYDKFIAIIQKEKPDLIAFETKTPVVKQHWKIIDELKKLNELNKLNKPKIILFGDHVTALPEESFQNSKVDFVCSLDYQESVFILKDKRIDIKPIGEIIDSYFNKEEDFQIKDIFGIKVPVYDRNLNIKFASVTKVIRHKIKEFLYEIELRSGRKVMVTGSHSVYILHNSEIIPKKVSELRKGDYLAIPQKLPSQNIRKIDLAREIKNNFISLKDKFLIYNSSSGPKAKIHRYIAVSKELCKILGYFVSEGHVQQALRPYPAKMIGFTFGYGEKEIADELIMCLKKVFRKTISVKKYSYKQSILIRVTNPLLAILFEEVFKTGISAETKHVPWLIFNTSYQNKIAFLEGYFRGDGTIHINRKKYWKTPELIAKTASKNLANELLYLFLTIGVIGSVKLERAKGHSIKLTSQFIKGTNSYLIRITGKEQIFKLKPIWGKLRNASITKKIIKSCNLFRKPEFSSIPINPLGLTDLYRGKYLIRGCKRGLMSRVRIKSILSLLKDSNGYSEKEISKIRKIVDGEVNFLKIIKIKQVSPSNKYVYDFSVNVHEKFVGGFGGVFLHNTGGDYDFSLLNLCNSLTPSTKDLKPELLEPGIYYRDNGQINPSTTLRIDGEQSRTIKNTGQFQLNHDLNVLPFIDRDLTNWRLYAYKNGNYKKTPGTYIMAGRDCWWGGCSFCSWPTLYPKFRARSVNNVLNEIGMLIEKHKIREIMDDTGTFPVGNWLRDFCQGMILRGYNKKVYLDCNMRFGALSYDDFSLMKKANFRLLLFGIESASQKTLDRINKNLKVERIIEDCKLAARAGLFPHITIMFGYPWENYEDALKTLKLGKWLLNKGYAYTMQATVVIPYPGTLLFEECKQNGLLKTLNWDDYDMKQPVMHSLISDGKIRELVQGMYKVSFQPEFILRKLFSLKDIDDLKYSLRAARKVMGHIFDFNRVK